MRFPYLALILLILRVMPTKMLSFGKDFPDNAAMYTLLKKTLYKWLGSNVFEHSAALAYGTLFALAPTLILAISLSGLIFGEEAAEGKIFSQIQGLIGAEPALVIQNIIRKASLDGNDLLATCIGILIFLIGASAVFAQLKSSLNDMWGVEANPKQNDLIVFFKNRLLSITMVVAFCFVLLVSLILSTILAAFGDWISSYLPFTNQVLVLFNLILSTAIIAAVFALIFKILPDADLLWKDVWLGGILTAALFAGGKSLIALYIQNSNLSKLYGAAASLVIIMLWVYYSSLILFLGAAFTHTLYCKHLKEEQVAELDGSAAS